MRFKKTLKNLLAASALCACFYGTARFCHKQTQGFRLSKIRANFSETPFIYPLKPGPEEMLRARQILSQKFHYLSRGLQSFVFISEDQNYVLKIFNNQYQRRIGWLKLPIFPPFLEKWREIRLEYNQKKLENTFRSYQIAYEELKEETGLLYAHLSPTEYEFENTQIIDRLNIAHPIDLDKTAFLIQKKADLVYDKIAQLMETGERKRAQAALSSLLHLLVIRYQKGIADNDPLIRTNFGFIGDHAVQIDVGPFSKDEKMKDPQIYRKEIERITTSLKFWVENHYPDLSDDLEHSLKRIDERQL